MSERVGTVAALHRYPVKSMQGEPVTSIEFDAVGAIGDRRYGIVSDDGAHVLSAKRHAALLLASATSNAAQDGVPRIELPDGSVIDELGEETDARLSDWLEQPVHLRRADDRQGSAYR